MNSLVNEYKLSTYIEVSELSAGKIYIVHNTLDDKIYIKKILEPDNYDVYNKLNKLSINNIPEIYELIPHDNELIIIEEYINGDSLKDILSRGDTFGIQDTIKYALELSDILKTLHSYNPPIIHRDIKPSNIMINKDGIVKLIDFDISRIHKVDRSNDTAILGTYGYAAPEQFGFNQSDARTDIYSLGITLNVMLTGEFPMNKLHKGRLSKIISKCIEMDPNKRFQNVEELNRDLVKLSKTSKIQDKKHYITFPNLPGFRSDILLFKILASSWYLILILTAFGFFSDDFSNKARLWDIVIVTYFFSLTLLYGNYNNIDSKLPLLRSRNIFIKLVGYILYPFLLFLIMSLILPS